MAEPPSEPRWLLLIHQIPPQPSYLRVKVGRRLQGLGAVAVKNSVYVLPRSDQALEDFQWVRREIVDGGGDASVCEARFVEGLSDAGVEELFTTAREADYAPLIQEARRLPARGGRRKGAAGNQGPAAALARLRKRMGEVAAIDFYGGPGRDTLERLLTAAEVALRPPAPPETTPLGPPAPAVRGRTWVTRTGVHIDRIASAWLIARFIDPEARFRFVAGHDHAPEGEELRFDMFEAEFTHESELCTFEVLLRRFGLKDPALRQIAEIVHDIDLKDAKFARPEAVGVDRLIAGIAMRHKTDEARIEAGGAVFESLHEFFKKKEAMSTLILTRRDVQQLLGMDDCIPAVEAAFRLHAEGRSLTPGVLGVRAPEGGFHIKAAGLSLDRLYFAAKVNGNYPLNPGRNGLPAIQGVIVLCDADSGSPLAVMDSMEVTARRTAAATAVAAKWLARPDSSSVTICGCGSQGREQLRALARVLPLRRAYAFDLDERRARAFAQDLSGELGLEVEAAADHARAVRGSDVCVTCTPSRSAFLMRDHVAPGTFVAAVGADSSDKQELDPRLMAEAVLVVDVLEQCASIGDLHHALLAGVLTRDGVHAELAEVVTGRKPGRRTDQEITIFDSTGTAIEDVAAAALVYERAVAAGLGLEVDLGAGSGEAVMP